MYQEIPLDECRGSKVKGIHISMAQAVIVFADATFTTLKAVSEYDGSAEIIPAKIKLLEFNHEEVVESGIATQAEIDAALAKGNNERREREQQWKRQQYESLKKEFEGA